MERWWKGFQTQAERTAWEKAEKADDPNFRVCMHMTARQLEKNMGFPKGYTAPSRYVTVYCYDWRQKGE